MLVTQSCPTLCNPRDCSPPGSSAHGIIQARILEWVAIFFSRGSSRLRDRTWVSYLVGRFFTIWATRKVFLPVSTDKRLFFFEDVHISLFWAFIYKVFTISDTYYGLSKYEFLAFSLRLWLDLVISKPKANKTSQKKSLHLKHWAWDAKNMKHLYLNTFFFLKYGVKELLRWSGG